MANSTVYPYGTGGSLPSSIGLVNDLNTGGVDKALTAEQGKAINHELNGFVTQDISSLTEYNFVIDATTYEWRALSNYTCVFLPVRIGETYLIQANLNRISRIAIMKDNSHKNGVPANFATGCSLVRIEAGTYYQVSIPADGAYMYILTVNNSNDSTPNSIALVNNKNEDASKRIDVINSQDISSNLPVYNSITINSSNLWQISGGTDLNKFACVLVPITPGERYIVVSNETNGIFAILASDTIVDETSPDFCNDYPNRLRLAPHNSYAFTAPADAAFLYITTKSSNNDYDTYAAIPKPIAEQFQEIGTGSSSGGGEDVSSIANLANAIGNKLYPLNPDLDENGFVVPETLQELNVQKKAEQFANLVWTPILDIPRNSDNSTNLTFPAGTPVTGLPYSSVKEIDKFIGRDVSIHTFMTAVNNPYSLLYTENVSEANSASAWGKTYHGVNCASYFGQVCSQFSAACQGGPMNYSTGIYPMLDKVFHEVVRIYDQSAQGARIGDTFWYEGHCRIIYGVKKNAAGQTTHVQIAESKHSTSVINSPITAANFDSQIASTSQPCVIFRPLWLYRNIDYTPSPYVAVRDETPQTVTYNDDICTFAGDKATFREGDTIAINYNLKSVGAWTAMQLYKGSTLIDTITIDPSVHVVDLTPRNLTYGKYKARLTDGTNYSDYTEWEIIQTTVAYSNDGTKQTITFSSANGEPVSLVIGLVSGSVRAQRVLTPDEISAGRCVVDLLALNAAQLPDNPIQGTDTVYLKVFFKGAYGRVTNEPMPIIL